MQTWHRLAIGAAALVLAVAVGTGAYAMRGDDGPSDEAATDADSGGTNVAAICIEGTVDCNDTVGLPASEYGCDQDGDCTEPAAAPDCSADAACDPLPADPGCTYEECYPDAAARCAELVARGELVLCAPDPNCIETQPAPIAEDGNPPPSKEETAPLCPPLEEPCVADDSCAPIQCVDVVPLPAEEDPPVAQGGTDTPAVEVVPCPPAGCAVPRPEPGVDDGEVRTLPALDCPAPPECVDGAARCLPPDCAVSSDGSVYCPEPSEPPQGGGGGSAPGNPGTTDPAPPDAAPQG